MWYVHFSEWCGNLKYATLKCASLAYFQMVIQSAGGIQKKLSFCGGQLNLQRKIYISEINSYANRHSVRPPLPALPGSKKDHTYRLLSQLAAGCFSEAFT